MTIGNRIRKQRESFGLSQTELAEKVKISKQTLYKYENNIITNIPSDKIEEIAKYLCVSPAYLMGWEDAFPIKSQPEIIEYYNMLNNIGQKEAIKRVKELMYIPEYISKTNDSNKQMNMEIAKEYEPIRYSHFTNALEAKKFLKEHNFAAFNGINTSSDEEIIKMANIVKTTILKGEGII